MEFTNSSEFKKMPEKKSLLADLNSLENGKTLEIKGELEGGVPIQEIINYKKLPSNIERVNYSAQNEKQKEGLFITKDIKISNKDGIEESIHQMLSKKTIYLANAKYNGLPEEDIFGLETMEFEKGEG